MKAFTGLGAGTNPQGGPTGYEVRAYQWWTENSTGTKSPRNVMAAPGTFVVWAPYGGGTAGHIALSIRGGYAISTNTGFGPSDVHVISIASLQIPQYYGSITPGA